MAERIRNKRHSKKAGLPPGTLIFTGEQKTEKPRISIIDYDAVNFSEKQIERIEDCFALKDKPTVSWINVDGLHNVEIIEKLGGAFGLHPLLLEDVLNTAQRPKFEDFDGFVFVVLKMLSFDDGRQAIESEQVSIVAGENFVVSFQERPGDVFDNIRERVRKAKGRIRGAGADYLMYAMLDAVVDSYFVILEKLGEKIEAIEEQLVKNPTNRTLGQIHYLKREMIALRKAIWPLREVISGLERSESTLIKQTTEIYLRDLYDHTIQVIDTVESFRDMVSGMIDIYLSSISNRMNAVMKVLTIIATIFIPLTFVAGIYGMNFKYMPELQWKAGYAMVWGVMVIIVGIMIYYFKRKKWF